jgi:hypothetical protein
VGVQVRTVIESSQEAIMVGLRRSLVTWLLICAMGLVAVGVIATLAPVDPMLLGAVAPPPSRSSQHPASPN